MLNELQTKQNLVLKGHWNQTKVGHGAQRIISSQLVRAFEKFLGAQGRKREMRPPASDVSWRFIDQILNIGSNAFQDIPCFRNVKIFN